MHVLVAPVCTDIKSARAVIFVVSSAGASNKGHDLALLACIRDHLFGGSPRLSLRINMVRSFGLAELAKFVRVTYCVNTVVGVFALISGSVRLFLHKRDPRLGTEAS